jgi:hypothetical protein
MDTVMNCGLYKGEYRLLVVKAAEFVRTDLSEEIIIIT